MSLQIPADVESSVRAFLANGRFASEEEVLRKALAALEREEGVLDAIREGIEDEAAGRMTPARRVIEAAKQRLGRAAP
jgi:predicted transcriptional regulator